MSNETRNILALQLFDIGAFKFGSFRLKLHEKNPDAPLSPIYVDLRILRSFPEVMNSAVATYEDLIGKLTFDILADVPTAATPIVAILSHRLRIPMISPRKEEKGHGLKRAVDGVFQNGNVALLIDDLITTAESKLEAISVLEEHGVKVRDVAVLLDREQGGAGELEKRGYACHAVFNLMDLLRLYLSNGKINSAQYQHTQDYLNITT